jgi:hypothetical protein
VTDRIVVFGRQPEAGRVKTRVAGGIGSTAAAEVYGELLGHTIDVVQRSGLPWILSLAAPAEPGWRETLPVEVEVEVQVEGDLGRRMHACLQQWFADGADRVVIVGSDIPGLTPGHLRSAFERLGDRAVVLGPASDGGYWLVGQRAPGVDCFSGVPWSSPETLAATRRRLDDLAVEWGEIDPLSDIDTIDDLRRIVDDPHIDPGLRHRLRALLR